MPCHSKFDSLSQPLLLESTREMELDYGTTYYQVTFADGQSTMPGLEPMVYVGDDIFGDESEPTHYFQDTVSVVRFGIYKDAEEMEDCLISPFSDDALGYDLVDIEQAADLVAKAAKRFKDLDSPKLKKAEGGNWFSVP